MFHPRHRSGPFRSKEGPAAPRRPPGRRRGRSGRKNAHTAPEDLYFLKKENLKEMNHVLLLLLDIAVL